MKKSRKWYTFLISLFIFAAELTGVLVITRAVSDAVMVKSAYAADALISAREQNVKDDRIKNERERINAMEEMRLMQYSQESPVITIQESTARTTQVRLIAPGEDEAVISPQEDQNALETQINAAGTEAGQEVGSQEAPQAGGSQETEATQAWGSQEENTEETGNGAGEAPGRGYLDVPLPHDLQDYIYSVCEERNVPFALAMSVIEVESEYNPDARSKDGHDYGLMQIRDVNHGWLGKKYGVSDFMDARQNTLCGISMLSDYLGEKGDIHFALMSYNFGEGRAKQLWSQGVTSSKYSRKVVKTYERIKEEL